MRVLVTGTFGLHWHSFDAYAGSGRTRSCGLGQRSIFTLYVSGRRPNQRCDDHPKRCTGHAVEDLVGFDGVLHLAALSNDPLGNLKPGLTDEINHLRKCANGKSRQDGRRSSFRVRLLLQQLRSSRRSNG